MSNARYRYLLERVYLDMVNADALARSSQDKIIVNVLEFKPFDAAFYNVGVPLPAGVPAEIAGLRVGSPAPFDEALFPLVLEAFQRLCVQVEKVFENFASMVSRNEWFPAILSPDLVELVESWREWWEWASILPTGKPRRGRVSGRDRTCWWELSRLLLALTPQPAYRGRSAGNVVYAKLTGEESPDPGLRLDDDGFLRKQNAYTWRSAGEMDSLSELRSLLELLSVVPVFPEMKGSILKRALAAPNRVLVDQAMGELAGEMAMSAIGGPMIHNGQLEGIIYAAAHGTRLGAPENQTLKDLASLGAARRHQLREHILRDVLLRAAQGDRELSPVLLVLRHLPLLFSVVGAAAVCLRQGDSRRSLPAGLIWRESTGEGQQMRFTPRLDEPQDRRLLEAIRLYARSCMAEGDRPVCSERKDSLRLLDAFTNDKRLVGRAQTVCAFNVQVPLRAEDWVYLLFFLEPPRWFHAIQRDSGKDQLHLETSIPQLWIELKAALDFVFAHRSSIEKTVLQLVYASAAHSLRGPASFALNFAELAADHLSKNNLEMAQRLLAQAQVALKTLTYSTRAAQKFFNRMASTQLSAGLEGESSRRKPADRKDATLLQKLDVKKIVDEYSALFQSANPQIRLNVESQGQPVSCLGHDELLHWLIWEMLENATRAARKIALSTGEVQQVNLSILYRARTISFGVDNPAGSLTRADCKLLVKNAQEGQPNHSNTSGGSGMGLAYCFWMAQEMKSRFRMDVVHGRCETMLTLRAEV